MASFDFDRKSGRYHIRFRHGGQPFKRSLQLDGQREAERVCGVIEEAIKDLKRGRLVLPEGADVGAFLVSGGIVASQHKLHKSSGLCNEPPPKAPTIAGIFGVYTKTLTAGSKEPNTIYTEGIHANHFKRILGDDRRFDDISVDVLQRYVNARVKAGVVRDTIYKELTTLRVV